MSPIQTKQFINNFYFPEPDWSSLPPNFPNLPKDGLSKEETHLLDGIKTAWFASSNGTKYLKSKAIKSVRFGTLQIIIAIIIYLALSFLASPDRKYAKSVNAATISATLRRMTQDVGSEIDFEQIVESTKSAVTKTINQNEKD